MPRFCRVFGIALLSCVFISSAETALSEVQPSSFYTLHSQAFLTTALGQLNQLKHQTLGPTATAKDAYEYVIATHGYFSVSKGLKSIRQALKGREAQYPELAYLVRQMQGVHSVADLQQFTQTHHIHLEATTLINALSS